MYLRIGVLSHRLHRCLAWTWLEVRPSCIALSPRAIPSKSRNRFWRASTVTTSTNAHAGREITLRTAIHDPSPGPRRLLKAPVAVHPLPLGERRAES
jgi:hypothetical protein